MSGYVEGVLVLLAINVVLAYAAFLPMAAGQLNLGVAGFAAIGAYVSAFISNNSLVPALLAIPLGGLAAGLVALVVAVPVLRTRGIYLALATFALGQIVQATILNLAVVGGAAGYPVTTFMMFPPLAAFAITVVVLVCLLFSTRLGIAITAVHDDEQVAAVMGMDVRALQVTALFRNKRQGQAVRAGLYRARQGGGARALGGLAIRGGDLRHRAILRLCDETGESDGRSRKARGGAHLDPRRATGDDGLSRARRTDLIRQER